MIAVVVVNLKLIFFLCVFQHMLDYFCILKKTVNRCYTE